MANVPVSRRKKHDFETTKVMKALRADITEAVINDFGYDPDRYQKMIERFAKLREKQPGVQATVDRMQRRHDSFYDAVIAKESDVVMSMWRSIVGEFEMGNSIFPSGDALMEEYRERRLHFDRCIGYLHALRVELQFIGETLPVDRNKYDGMADRIKTLTSMVKGVRQSSNRFLKAKTGGKTDASKVSARRSD